MKRIKAGYGYWDTSSYGIGGCFRRAGPEGVEIASVIRTFPPYRGCDEEGRTTDGRTVVYRRAHTEEVG